jgi:hypothetical protein
MRIYSGNIKRSPVHTKRSGCNQNVHFYVLEKYTEVESRLHVEWLEKDVYLSNDFHV